MNKQMTFVRRLGLLATALLAVGCSDSVGPRNPEFATATTVMEVTGLGQIGTGSLTPGDSVTTFDFDVRSDLSGTFTATDYAAVHPNGVPATLTTNHAADAATGITAYRNSSTACSDPTRGVEFDAVGREDNGALDPYTLAVCDNGPANSGQDFWSIVIPVDNFRLSGNVTSGDIVKSTGSSSAGSLVVSTSTSGSSLPSGYTVTVDGFASQPIGINSSVTFTGLTATSHTVTLSGVPTNCTVSGGTSETVTVPAGGSATAAFSVSCTAFSGVEVSGTGQIGPGSPTPGSNLQTFTFDVRSDLSGTLAYTDYSRSASLQVGPTFPGTGITAFRTSSNACADPTKGAEFDGMGQVTGATGLLNFTVAVCDNGPAGSGLDFFSFSAPSISYSKSGTLTGGGGDIVKSTTGSSATGQLTVTTTTTGTSLPSGYTVTVDGTTSQSIGINSSVTFAKVAATSHTVALSGVPSNCTVSGGTSQTVTVPSGGTATAAFSVSCSTASGNLTVTTSTSGSSLPSGYTVTVDGTTSQSIGINSSVTFANLAATSHTVVLSGIPSNCTVSGGTSRTVTVPSGGTATVSYSVTCTTAPGNLTVTTSTSGSSLPSGYTVTVDGTTSQSIGINGSVTFTNLAAANHTVMLGGVPSNCTVSGGTSRTVTVPSGGTATVSYSVSCTTPNQPPIVNAGSDQTVLLGVLYTESASFSDPDNDGPWSYTINWGDGSSTSGSTSSQGTISASHSYLLGSFTIRVTVTDSRGASGSGSKVLTVITGLPGLP